jgi:transcriptional regulator with XRE-family HTH domain
MTIEQKINMVAGRCGISQAEIARRIGTTPSNLSQKVKKGTLRQDDMEAIASAVGATYWAGFMFPDGTQI